MRSLWAMMTRGFTDPGHGQPSGFPPLSGELQPSAESWATLPQHAPSLSTAAQTPVCSHRLADPRTPFLSTQKKKPLFLLPRGEGGHLIYGRKKSSSLGPIASMCSGLALTPVRSASVSPETGNPSDRLQHGPAGEATRWKYWTLITQRLGPVRPVRPSTSRPMEPSAQSSLPHVPVGPGSAVRRNRRRRQGYQGPGSTVRRRVP